MTALAERLKRLIAAAGPISVADYMAACLFDPDHGYYTTREPFGAKGDFTTAPEISQMFGELVAVWCFAVWQATGGPMPVTLVEIGPGRGTMMRDMLRTLDRLDPGFAGSAQIALVEASTRLTNIQKATLGPMSARCEWLAGPEELPQQPLIVVANELFDALPVRQFVNTTQGWRERMVGLDGNGNLAFVAGAVGLDPSAMLDGANDAPDGAILEIAPAREALMEKIAIRLARDGGAALFFDYGHLQLDLGDTLQAVRRHAYDGVFSHPGEADLTSHVDFAALAKTAAMHGLATRLMEQGDFLRRMGLLERAGALGENADEDTRERLSNEVERLAGPDGMGKLFKVLIVSQHDMRTPPDIGTD